MTTAGLHEPITFALLARIPSAGVAAFRAYEANVLPLLIECGGVLDRRMRNDDGTFELHVVRFPSEPALERYRADPRRAAAAPLLAQSGAEIELIRVADCG